MLFLNDCSAASLHIVFHLCNFFSILSSDNFTIHLSIIIGTIDDTPSSVAFCKIKSNFCSFTKATPSIICVFNSVFISNC